LVWELPPTFWAHTKTILQEQSRILDNPVSRR